MRFADQVSRAGGPPSMPILSETSDSRRPSRRDGRHVAGINDRIVRDGQFVTISHGDNTTPSSRLDRYSEFNEFLILFMYQLVHLYLIYEKDSCTENKITQSNVT